MSTETNREQLKKTKSNLEIKLRNDIIAFKKVLKWAKTIRNRIETTLQQLDCNESHKVPLTNQKVIYHSTILNKSCSKNSTQIENMKVEANKDINLSQPTLNRNVKNEEVKISVQTQPLNPVEVDIVSKPVKTVQIDSKNVEKMVESLVSNKLSGFIMRVDALESKLAENKKNISIINNDLNSVRTNINLLDGSVKEMVTQTNYISTKSNINHVEMCRDLERILNFLQT